MFHPRSSTSSPPSSSRTPSQSRSGLSPSSSASSSLSTADSIDSIASSSSSSHSIASALSATTSLASIPTDPSLPSIADTDTSKAIKEASLSRRTSTSPRKQQSQAAASSRRATLLTSPRTTKTTTSTASPRPTASRRSTITHRTSEHRGSVATMAKKAKVGSTAKSSPFSKLASAEVDADLSLATVVEDEASTSATSTKSVDSESKQNVVVCVRMRPSRTSPFSSEPSVWNLDPTKNSIIPTEHHPAIAKRTTSSERAGASTSIAALPSLEPDNDSSTYYFSFDKLITPSQTTDDMFDSHISPVVRAAMDGYNGTVFAYGQTGSGKTHTMSGSESEPGVIPRAVRQVFQLIESEPEREFLLRVSYLEIYNETLKDLLAPLPALSASLQTTDRPASPVKGGTGSTLRIIEDQKSGRVLITGLREEIVTQADVVLDLIQRGQDERHVGATDWNERSSRSHCVFQLTIESRARSSTAGREVRISQLNLIDLAGSERAASQVERRKEGAFINKSLLTLGTVIGKLTEPDCTEAHIPYRDSKLTRILQTSLSGNARIAVICTLSPDTEHANETLSTLKFGKRCKLVVTTAKKGTSMDDKALLQKYRRELDALRARLEANTITDGISPSEDSRESREKLSELEQQREAAQREVDTMQQQRTNLRGQIEHLTRLILTSNSVANDTAGPSTPRARALARRGPRMSDFSYHSPTPTSAPSSDSTKPFELESQLAALRRQLRSQIEARESLIKAHAAEIAERDAKAAELQEAIRCNEEELDEAEVAYDKLKEERDEARRIALSEQEKARENKRRLVEEQEANRLLKLVAQSRATEEDRVAKEEIESLRERLRVKEGEVEEVRVKMEGELVEARRLVEEERDARRRVEEEVEEAGRVKQTLQAELAEAVASVTELKEKQAATDDDVDAEFRDLVRGGQARLDEEAQTLLTQREAELADREVQLERLRAELEQTRRELQAKPIVSPDTLREVANLKDELAQSEEERQTLRIELAKARAAASGHDRDAEKITALDIELKRANARVEELEKEVAAEKKRSEEAIKKVSRPLPVPLATHELKTGGGSVPSSPVKAFAAGGSKLRPGASTVIATSGLNRAGSVKEYRRYQTASEEASSSNPPSPSPASGTRSVLLKHEAVFGGGSSTSNKAEREEIERLNAVINSQRAIMADLEKSVASWKTRMSAQTELIHKLMAQTTAGSGGVSPPVSDAENDDTSCTTPKRKTESSGFHTLPRTTHLALAPGSEPYYGAHTFNRPLLQPASPTKNFASYGSWSRNGSPSPLPVTSKMEEGVGKRKPRKTIEMDLKLLNASPRVEGGRNRFGARGGDEGTPTRRRGTNASQYYI